MTRTCLKGYVNIFSEILKYISPSVMSGSLSLVPIVKRLGPGSSRE